MPSVHMVSEPLARLCRPVPVRGPGVCAICRGWTAPEFSTCYSCTRVTGQVRRPCHRVNILREHAAHKDKSNCENEQNSYLPVHL